MKKIISGLFAWFLMMTMLALFVPPMWQTQAQAADDVDGDFTIKGFNNAPRVLAFQGPTEGGNYTLTPRDTYYMSITVEDEDGLSDIKALELRFYYAVTEGAVEPNEFADLENVYAQHPTTNLSSTAMVIRWENEAASAAGETPAEDDAPQSGFHIVSDAALDTSLISWEIVQSTVPAIASGDTNLTGQSFTFEVAFRISRVAREATQNLWRIGTTIEDARIIEEFVSDQENNGTTVFPSLKTSNSNPIGTGFDLNSSDSYQMSFYGEISLPSEAAVTWRGDNEDGTVNVGTTFAENVNTSLAGIKFYANSEFNEQIQSSPTWKIVSGSAGPNVPGNITFASIQEAALAGNDQQAFRIAVGEAEPFTVENTVLIAENSLKRNLFSQATDWTSEAGVEYTFYFFLELSQDFRNAQYSGELIFTVTNFIATD